MSLKTEPGMQPKTDPAADYHLKSTLPQPSNAFQPDAQPPRLDAHAQAALDALRNRKEKREAAKAAERADGDDHGGDDDDGDDDMKSPIVMMISLLPKRGQLQLALPRSPQPKMPGQRPKSSRRREGQQVEEQAALHGGVVDAHNAETPSIKAHASLRPSIMRESVRRNLSKLVIQASRVH